MIRITICCAGGWSTSLLLKKFRKAAESKNIEIEARAAAISSFNEYKNCTDVLLLGPQVAHAYKETVEKYPNLKVSVIDQKDFAMMNGEMVLQQVLDLMQ